MAGRSTEDDAAKRIDSVECHDSLPDIAYVADMNLISIAFSSNIITNSPAKTRTRRKKKSSQTKKSMCEIGENSITEKSSDSLVPLSSSMEHDKGIVFI